MSAIRKPYNTEDDTVFGTKWVYCMQHRAVHSTGWCTVYLIDKIPLSSQTKEEAEVELALKKEKLAEDLKHDQARRQT